jgi:hypothetical protein
MKKESWMKTAITYALIIAYLAGLGVILSTMMVDAIIYDYNKTLPKQVDPVSIMTSIDRTGRTVNVRYVLMSQGTADIIAGMNDATAKRVMKESFCDKKILNFFNIKHIIKSPTGRIVYQQVLSKKECRDGNQNKEIENR